jgi:hypothetical protein
LAFGIVIFVTAFRARGYCEVQLDHEGVTVRQAPFGQPKRFRAGHIRWEHVRNIRLKRRRVVKGKSEKATVRFNTIIEVTLTGDAPPLPKGWFLSPCFVRTNPAVILCPVHSYIFNIAVSMQKLDDELRAFAGPQRWLPILDR